MYCEDLLCTMGALTATYKAEHTGAEHNTARQATDEGAGMHQTQHWRPAGQAVRPVAHCMQS